MHLQKILITKTFTKITRHHSEEIKIWNIFVLECESNPQPVAFTVTPYSCATMGALKYILVKILNNKSCLLLHYTLLCFYTIIDKGKLFVTNKTQTEVIGTDHELSRFLRRNLYLIFYFTYICIWKFYIFW